MTNPTVNAAQWCHHLKLGAGQVASDIADDEGILAFDPENDEPIWAMRGGSYGNLDLTTVPDREQMAALRAHVSYQGVLEARRRVDSMKRVEKLVEIIRVAPELVLEALEKPEGVAAWL